MKTSLRISHAITSLHFGIGEGLSDIDLPTAREIATGLPIGPGSSLKGCLRDQCEDAKKAQAIFGPDQSRAEEHVGSLQLTDLRLLCLPVRSLRGVFGLVTAPYVLERFNRDLELCGLPVLSIPSIARPEQCLVGDDSVLSLQHGGAVAVVLQDLDISSRTDPAFITDLSGRLAGIVPQASRRLCIVHDDVMSFFCATSLQVDARIALDDDSKTVKAGALWYEESLPPETIMAAVATAAPSRKVAMTDDAIMTALDALIERPLQVGGDATTGRGLVHLRRIGGADANA